MSLNIIALIGFWSFN